jgi:hypothetical protein
MRQERGVVILGPRTLARLIASTPRRNVATPVPRILVVPFVAEQRNPNGSPHGVVGLRVNEVIERSTRALCDCGNVARHPSFGSLSDSNFWASSLQHFERTVWPKLPRVSVVVTHGNFMRNEISGRGSGSVPNGGIVCLQQGDRKVFFVRHCTTCHNITRRGSSALTVCHNFKALESARQLVYTFASSLSPDTFGVFASPMPRAVLTALALQRVVSETERQAFCATFGACAPQPSLAEAQHHEYRHGCEGNRTSPFCA